MQSCLGACDRILKRGFAFRVRRFKCRLGVLKGLIQGFKLGCGILLACLDRLFKLCLNVLKLLSKRVDRLLQSCFGACDLFFKRSFAFRVCRFKCRRWRGSTQGF